MVDDSAKHLLTNADMGPGEIREFCPVDEAGHSLLRAAMRQLNMSARAYHRTLKLARTIADLAGAERIATASGRSGAVSAEVAGMREFWCAWQHKLKGRRWIVYNWVQETAR